MAELRTDSEEMKLVERLADVRAWLLRSRFAGHEHAAVEAAAHVSEAADTIARLVEALRDIASHTNPDDPESYRADDREGCLDTVHDLARAALQSEGAKP